MEVGGRVVRQAMIWRTPGGTFPPGNDMAVARAVMVGEKQLVFA